MDFHLKQWREHQHQHQHHQEESEEQQHQPPSAKVPRLLLQVDSHEPPPSESDHQPALPLFSPTHQQPSKINCFSTYPDSKPPLPPPASPTSTRFPCRAGGGGGGYFSMNQWQELELQALIFRHMVAGAAVPPELLQLVKKSLFSSPSYYLNNNNYSYYQPTLLQAAGYWGRGAMDPEPGRCRRTDGKKWRCSRDVVAGQKYCERHVHRGRNRSRKPVEFPVPTASAATAATTPHGVAGADLGVAVAVGANKSSPAFASSLQHSGLGVGGGSHGPHFSLSGPTSSSSSLDIFQLNQGASDSETKPDSKFSFEPQNDTTGGSKYNGRVLRRFFDDWPRSDNTSEGDPSRVSPATSLSISTPVADSSLDFLKLSTGNGEDNLARRVDGSRNSNVWSGENQVATMGGPLAEALRSSTGSSPTSVLNQIPRSASETSYVAA